MKRTWIESFLEGKSVAAYVLDSASRQHIRKALEKMGTDPSQIRFTDHLGYIKKIVQVGRPSLIIVDTLEEGGETLGGMEVLESFRGYLPTVLDRVLVLIHPQPSNKLVNLARESDVDLVLKRPFDEKTFRENLEKALLQKQNATLQDRLIDEARLLLNDKQYREARLRLENGIREEDRSAEAWYQLGVAFQYLMEPKSAVECFQKALAIHPLHLNALSKIYPKCVADKNYDEALRISDLLLQNYPVDRINALLMIRVSVANRKFANIFEIYENCRQNRILDQNLRGHLAAALILSGKNFLEKDHVRLGLDAFEKAIQCRSDLCRIWKEMGEVLLERGMIAELESLLAKIPFKLSNEIEIEVLRVRILERTEGGARALHQVYQLFQKGIFSPDLYKIAIRRSIELGRRRSVVEELVFDAIRKYPEHQKAFKVLMENAQFPKEDEVPGKKSFFSRRT